MTATASIVAIMVAGAGLPLAYALTRNVPLAVLATPLATALLTALATIMMLIAGGTLMIWMALLFAAQAVLFLPRLRRGTAEPSSGTAWTDVPWVVIPLLAPFLAILAPPNAWDAHSIWWLHAAYFNHGAEASREAMANPGFSFSHPDYPPLASSAVAVAWSVTDGYSFRIAQVVSSTITFSAVAMLACAVRRVTAGTSQWVSRLAAVGVGLAVWATAPWVVTSGYSDALWSAAFTAAAVLLLVGEHPLARPALPLFLLTVAALTKNEGVVAAALLATVVTLRERGRLRRAWCVWLPVAAGAGWSMLARHLGAATDLVEQGRFGDLLRLDPALVDRVRPTLAAVYGSTGPVVLFALAAAVLGGLFLRRRRRELQLGADLWLWCVNAGYTGSLILTYVTTPHDVRWHLATSVDRVSLPIVLLACVSTVCWGATAIGRPRIEIIEDDQSRREPVSTGSADQQPATLVVAR